MPFEDVKKHIVIYMMVIYKIFDTESEEKAKDERNNRYEN